MKTDAGKRTCKTCAFDRHGVTDEVRCFRCVPRNGLMGWVSAEVLRVTDERRGCS